uniref:Uncharacterized protein n=1 Tax=Anguilla anguilla TaxID=7936 RepID=A0A0E9TJZ8_ANGAN
MTKLTHLTWFLGSELVTDFQVKNENQLTVCLKGIRVDNHWSIIRDVPTVIVR